MTDTKSNRTVKATDLDVGHRMPDFFGGSDRITAVHLSSGGAHVIVTLADGRERVYRAHAMVEVVS